jgi:peptide/nickel transport system substrate-binding protein
VTVNIKIRFATFVACVSVLTALVGCSTESSQRRPAPGVLRIVEAGSLDSLIPEFSGATTSWDVAVMWGAWFFFVDDRSRLVPELATQVPTLQNGGISRNGRMITYHLRRGVQWQDGAPFDARDVIFTWHAIMNPRNDIINRAGYDLITSIDAPDPYTIRMNLVRPYAPAVASFFGPGDTAMCVLPRHLLARYPDINHVPYDVKPIGTGPFVVQSYDPTSGVVLVANPHYWRGPPKLKEIDYRLVSDPNSRVVMLRSGEADLYYDPEGQLVPQLEAIPGFRHLNYSYNASWFLAFNVRHAPLHDVRVRRAIAMGIDRAFVVHAVVHDDGVVAQSDQPPFSWAYDRDVRAPNFDPVEAGKLLDAAGWHATDGRRENKGHQLALTLSYIQDNKDVAAFAPLFQSEMEHLGIDIALKPYPSSLYWAAADAGGILNSGNYDVAVTGWAGAADPDDSELLMCDQRPPAGFNVSFYCDPRIDAAERVALSSYDTSVRRAAYARIQELVDADLPYDYLWYQVYRDAVRDDLTGYRPARTFTPLWNSWEWSR